VASQTEAGTGGRHGPDNMVVTWTPDSQYVVYLTKQDQWNSWIQYMYKAPVAGGRPTPMAIDSAVGLATFGPDGHTIAFNWTGSRITTAVDNGNRTVTYGYTNGHLTSVTSPGLKTTYYGYNPTTACDNTLMPGTKYDVLTNITDPRGITTTLSYYVDFTSVPPFQAALQGVKCYHIHQQNGIDDYFAYAGAAMESGAGGLPQGNAGAV